MSSGYGPIRFQFYWGIPQNSSCCSINMGLSRDPLLYPELLSQGTKWCARAPRDLIASRHVCIVLFVPVPVQFSDAQSGAYLELALLSSGLSDPIQFFPLQLCREVSHPAFLFLSDLLNHFCDISASFYPNLSPSRSNINITQHTEQLLCTQLGSKQIFSFKLTITLR